MAYNGVTNHTWVYSFREADINRRDLLGGKGAGVASMTQTGIPVPPGFTISTEACRAYLTNDNQFPPSMWEQTHTALHEVERLTGKTFGDANNPLLVSVRSGAALSMPGMMDTVLNLGLNQHTRDGLAKLTANPRFANDAYRRFIQFFGEIVMGVDGEHFDHVMEHHRRDDSEGNLTAAELADIAEEFKQIITRVTGKPFPEDPYEQLRQAIGAVFASWNGRRARDYRKVHRMPDDMGTACNIQAMVFGNMGDDSATGVAFTRNPSTGEATLFGEYLTNAQGEDVVAGIRTPKPIQQLSDEMPGVWGQLTTIVQHLENHYQDVQDIEFTIERGKLWMLQTRTAKRSGAAAVKIAVDMVAEGVIDHATAIRRVQPAMLDQLLHPRIDPAIRHQHPPLTTGLPASPGAAAGHAVFHPDEAVARAAQGEAVILIRLETSPEDFSGMHAAQAVLTARGGMTSHAAVVARGMGKPCVSGAGDMHISYAHPPHATVGDHTIKQDDWITLDGGTGEVFAGHLPTIDPTPTGDFATFMEWVDEIRTMGVRANADTPHDAAIARQFGAEGIGLCRTEHMFFEGDRIDAMRQMILAERSSERRAALERIQPLQQADFEGIFRAMDGYPVTIRTLDPPLHEFLPRGSDQITEAAQRLGVDRDHLHHRVETLEEINPMLGFRGCRLGIAYPEIIEMQARAIFTAAANVARDGVQVFPEVMVPLVGIVGELTLQEAVIRRVAAEVQAETGMTIPYHVGTMIELPRAALTAHQIAEVAEFFSFGTNDLTQTTLGMSRDDSGAFLPAYVEKKLLPDDPFQSLDQTGVGELVRIGVERGRSTNPNLKVGICGEHGGDPASVMFFYGLGLNYVSCSPYRVPIARLAAAQAVIAAAETVNR